MEFAEVLNSRHSVRYFDARPVSRDLVIKTVEGAQKAPSWINAQEWRVWALMGTPLEEMRKEHSARDLAGVKGYSETPVSHRTQFSPAAQENMRAFSQSREDAGLAKVKEESQAELFHAPCVLYLTLPKGHGDFAMLDLGGFEATLLLCAQSLGLASIPAYNLVKYPDLVRKYTNIPETEEIVIGVALGYAARHPLNDFRSTRVPVGKVLTICG